MGLCRNKWSLREREGETEREWWVSAGDILHITAKQSIEWQGCYRDCQKCHKHSTANTLWKQISPKKTTERNTWISREQKTLKVWTFPTFFWARVGLLSGGLTSLDSIYLEGSVTFLSKFATERAWEPPRTENKINNCSATQDPQLVRGSAQRCMEARCEPEIHIDRFVISQGSH